MADRETRPLNAIEKMTSQYSVYYVAEAVSRLMSDDDMPDRERMLLAALVEMVDKCLDRYEDGTERYDDGVDTLAMSAGEHAVAALADLGLMVVVTVRPASAIA